MSYKQEAYARGEKAALAAASWCCDGNTPQEHIRRMVKWFDDGDPQKDQYLPSRPNLSGEWDRDLTTISLYRDITGREPEDSLSFETEHGYMMDELAEAFEEGVADHFEPECERILKAALTEDE